jgi:hypothetical protein
MSTIPGFDASLQPITDDGDAVNQFNSNYTYDVVAIVDPDTGLQLFEAAESMKANVGPLSKLMDHPLEDGSPVTDYRIVLPVSIELGILVNAQDFDSTYDQIKDAFTQGDFLTVRTNADTFENMVIEGMPHDESPELFGMLAISLRLREVNLITVQYQALPASQVETPTDQSTVQRGEQQPQSSVLYDASQAFFKSK